VPAEPGPEAAAGERTAAEITRWIAAARGGDAGAGEALFSAVYADLKRIAHRQLAGQRRDATLSTTALVHEAYLRLVRPESLDLNDRNHFFAVAARAMRQILVDHARRKAADKRGGGVLAVELDEGRVAASPAGAERAAELVALDAALERLERLDERLARVVEWRFFGGLTLEEIGAALGLTERTMKRDWRKARAFLFRELHGPEAAV
jgi:RNA polymerase sigma factor (TIGR02999 family)